MKKIILGLGILLLATSVRSQGLEGVIVEKYYITDANDVDPDGNPLPVGSTTYRIYIDMATGYKFQALYGVAGQELRFSTTTGFYNQTDRGGLNGNDIAITRLQENTVMLDSWWSTGAAAASKMGVLKTGDDGVGTIVNQNGMLQNNHPDAGIPLTVEDGLLNGTPEAVTFVGLGGAENIFNQGPPFANLLSTFNGSIASLNGSTGPTADNMVLVAQVTTEGKFCFKLNIQLGTPLGGTENYVAENPGGSDILHPDLVGCFGPNSLPSVSITNPAGGASFVVGDAVTIDATASDLDGTVDSVEFFVDGSKISVDFTAPYSANWTSTLGAHTLTAVATDNEAGVTTSAAVNINVTPDPPPSVSIINPAGGSTFIVGDAVTIDVNAADNISVSEVEFFVDAVSIGTDNTAPYSATWSATLGGHVLTAKAKDNLNQVGTSAAVNINVLANTPPSVSITAPAGGSTFTHPAVVTIDATASDPDGTVDSVEFFVNGVKIGADFTAPYSFNWNSVIGAAQLRARATDNKGAATQSAIVNIDIADPNALPYKVGSINQTCLVPGFCLPVIAVDTVANVIGYDVVLQYDITRVKPTGVIQESNDLISSAYTDVINSIDTVNGLVNISSFLNASAPANSYYQGVGTLFCVEFVKTDTMSFTSIDTAHFSVSDMQESYFNGVSQKLVQAGMVTTYKDSLFSATLEFWTDNSPIRYNGANPNQYLVSNIFGTDPNCNDSSAISVQPDTAGVFVHSIWNGKSVQIERDVLGTTDVQAVVNGFDAVLTRRVLINDGTFIPTIHQVIAMDVNTDGVISAGDVSQINQRTVLILPEFKQQWNHDIAGVSDGRPSKDWLFVDTVLVASAPYQISASFPSDDAVGYSKYRVPVVPFCLPVPVTDYDNCPLIAPATYTGIMLGDVDGNYDAIAPDGLIRKTSEGTVVFDLANAVIGNGIIDVPVSLSSKQTVQALDFALNFNEDKLGFSGIVHHVKELETLAHFKADDHTLRFTSSSLTAIEKNQPVVSVRFNMLSDDASASDVHAMKAYINGEPANIQAVASEMADENTVKVYPNPASESIFVEVSQQAKAQLMDMSGRQVIREVPVNENEVREFKVDNLPNGVYMIRVYNEKSVTIQRFVVNR